VKVWYRVRDLDAGSAFYTGTLGFDEVFRDVDHDGNQQNHRPERVLAPREASPFERARWGHVAGCTRVDDTHPGGPTLEIGPELSPQHRVIAPDSSPVVRHRDHHHDEGQDPAVWKHGQARGDDDVCAGEGVAHERVWPGRIQAVARNRAAAACREPGRIET